MVDRVTVVPLSGYANRFQAIASAGIMAEDLGAELQVLWLPTSAAPAAADWVFGPGTLECVAPEDESIARLGGLPEEVPLHVTFDRGGERMLLRGHLKGEQRFMPEVGAAVNSGRLRELVFVAGGKFMLSSGPTLSREEDADFRCRREAFYRRMTLHSAVEDVVRERVSSQSAFIGLHLRYSDRSHQAPTRRAVARAIRAVQGTMGLKSLFIASDTPSELARWMRITSELGLVPWAERPAIAPRSDPKSTHAALVDWRLLGSSRASVFFAESSFAEEAAVASGHFEESIALLPSRARAIAVPSIKLWRSAITYPKRHWIDSRRGDPTV